MEVKTIQITKHQLHVIDGADGYAYLERIAGNPR